MKLGRRQFLSLAGSAVATTIVPGIAPAQAYPARPVRVIVPNAPGAAIDVTTRLIIQKLSERLGKQFYVENVGGGSGNIGMGRAAQAALDGYTILFGAFQHIVNPALYDKVPYDPIKSFDPVTLAVSTTVLLAVNPSVPARTVEDLIALIKANPGKYNYASGGGVGSSGHLVGEQFRLAFGLDLPHIPFNGANLAVGSTVAGHTPIAFVAPTPAIPLVRENKLRVVAVMSKIRSQALPDVPTMAEAGYPDIRVRELVRGFRSGRNAQTNHRIAQSRDRGDHCTPRYEGASNSAWARPHRQHDRRLRQDHQGRGREMG
jgi:tripartite-type tricarboxylate transporter receptor subunit TctC